MGPQKSKDTSSCSKAAGLVTLKETQQEIEAFVYIMHEDRPLGIPSNFYVEVCKNGYDDFGFDKKYLRAAIKASVGGM